MICPSVESGFARFARSTTITKRILFDSYDQECFERDMTTKDILREKIGVCREYVKIFSEFCELAGFRVKGIRGYTKGPNFVPGNSAFILNVASIDF